MALIGKEVVATTTMMSDSPLGLPLDVGYKEEADQLRNAGRKICEIGYLSLKSELFGRGLFSMFNFKKLDFMFTLFKVISQYVIFYSDFDDMCIVTNPQYMIFKFLPFEIIGPVKYYGYDRVSVKKKAAVFKRLPCELLREIKRQYPNISGTKLSIYKMMLETVSPKEFYDDKFVFTPDDLRYFFVEKSDVLKEMKQEQRAYIKSAYGLSDSQFDQLLAGNIR